MSTKTNDSKSLWLQVHGEIPDERVSLGRASSNAYRSDPKMLGFMAARYKFVAKMLDGCKTALEAGCGDGFGAPVVAQAVGHLICTDIDEATLRDNVQRLSFLKNAAFEYFDFRREKYAGQVESVFCVDVVEHLYPEEEAAFIANLSACVLPFGVAILGTPNKTADQYASENSRKGHVNLKDHKSLRNLVERHFHRVFMFSMNDEVVHTGYYPMAHYLWAIGIGPRR